MLFLFVAGRKQTITVFVGETSRGLLPLREIIQHGSFCAIRNQTRQGMASATPNRGGSSSGCGVMCSRQTPRSAQHKRQPAPLPPTTACSKPMRFVLRVSVCLPSLLPLQPLLCTRDFTVRHSCKARVCTDTAPLATRPQSQTKGSERHTALPDSQATGSIAPHATRLKTRPLSQAAGHHRHPPSIHVPHLTLLLCLLCFSC